MGLGPWVSPLHMEIIWHSCAGLSSRVQGVWEQRAGNLCAGSARICVCAARLCVCIICAPYMSGYQLQRPYIAGRACCKDDAQAADLLVLMGCAHRGYSSSGVYGGCGC